MFFGAIGCDGATAGGVLPVRSSGGQVLGGCLGGEFGAGGDAELGEDVGQVHLDGAGGDEQAPGDGVVPQAFADQPDDIQFSRGQAGPARGGSFAAAALAGGVGHRVVEGKFLALFPGLGEAVLAEDVPGLAGGAGSGRAVGGEAGSQVAQRLPGRAGGGEQAGGVGEALAGRGEHAEQLDAVAGVDPGAALVPLHRGLAHQVVGGGELAPVPGQDALGVAQGGGGDRLAAAAELGARLADGGGRGGSVTGDGGHAGQCGQGGGDEHDDGDAAAPVRCPAQRADGGHGVVPGRGQ